MNGSTKTNTGEKHKMEDVIQRDRDARTTTDRFIGHKAIPTDNVNQCGTAQPMQYDPTAFLNDLFSYHAPRPDQLPKYQAIRSAAKHFAEIVLSNTPPSADQSASIRKIREAVMTANAAIALDGRA
jgi:hypothetical protein